MVSNIDFGGLRTLVRPEPKERKRDNKTAQSRTDDSTIPQRSPRARLNVVPDDESLFRLIALGRKSLRLGRYWDRGAIINIIL